MPYATPASLLTRFSDEEIAQRADRSIPRLTTGDLLVAVVAGASLDAWTAEEQAAAVKALGVINRALADADSTIDGYLAARYPVPFADAPTIVERLACDMARYYLYDDQATETVQKRYDAALAYFRDVAAGRASLGPDVQAESSTGAGSVEMSSTPTVWARDRSRGFI